MDCCGLLLVKWFWHYLTIAACLYSFDSLYVLGCSLFFLSIWVCSSWTSGLCISCDFLSFFPWSPITIVVVYNIIIARIFVTGTNFHWWFWWSVFVHSAAWIGDCSNALLNWACEHASPWTWTWWRYVQPGQCDPFWPFAYLFWSNNSPLWKFCINALSVGLLFSHTQSSYISISWIN